MCTMTVAIEGVGVGMNFRVAVWLSTPMTQSLIGPQTNGARSMFIHDQGVTQSLTPGQSGRYASRA